MWPVRVGREVPEPPRPVSRFEPHRSCVDLERASSGRFRLRHGRAVPSRFVLRIDDTAQRVVPRRLAVQLYTEAEVDDAARVHVAVRPRIVRPSLFPGPAFEPRGGTTAIRDRVVRTGVGVRWAQVVATTTTIPAMVAGCAHADQHGEFLLVVTDIDQDVVQSGPTLFTTRGYRLDGLRTFDTFPMTHHLESVALLNAQVRRARECKCPL
jgi:hypothetical protein